MLLDRNQVAQRCCQERPSRSTRADLPAGPGDGVVAPFQRRLRRLATNHQADRGLAAVRCAELRYSAWPFPQSSHRARGLRTGPRIAGRRKAGWDQGTAQEACNKRHFLQQGGRRRMETCFHRVEYSQAMSIEVEWCVYAKLPPAARLWASGKSTPGQDPVQTLAGYGSSGALQAASVLPTQRNCQ